MRYALPALALYSALLLAPPAQAQSITQSRDRQAENIESIKTSSKPGETAERSNEPAAYNFRIRPFNRDRFLQNMKNYKQDKTICLPCLPRAQARKVYDHAQAEYMLWGQKLDTSPMKLFGFVPVSTSRRYSNTVGNGLIKWTWSKIENAFKPSSNEK